MPGTDSRRDVVVQDIVAEAEVMSALAQSTFLQMLGDLRSPAIMVTNAQGQVVWVNEGYERLSGWTLPEIAGQYPQDFLHGEGTDQNVVARLNSDCHQQDTVTAELLNYHKDRSPFWVSIESRAVWSPSEQLLGHVSLQSDVSQRKALVIQGLRERTLLQAITRAQSQFISSGDDRTVFDVLLQDLLQLTSSQHGLFCEVCLSDNETPQLMTPICGGMTTSGVYSVGGSSEDVLNVLSLPMEVVLQSRQPLIHCSVRTDSLANSEEGRIEASSYLCLPILDNDRLIGIVGVAGRNRHYSDGDVTFLKPLLETISLLIVARGRECDRRQLQESLLEAQSLLEETGRVAGIGGWELTPHTKKVRWTAQTCRIHEVPVDFEPTLENAIAFYAPEAQKQIAGAVENGMNNGTGWDLELPLITARGRRIWVRAKGSVELLNGAPIRIYGTFQDITVRLQRERTAIQHRRILELIATGQSLPLILHKICRVAESVLSHAHVIIVLSDNSQEISSAVVGGLPDRIPGLLKGCSLHDAASLVEKTVRGLLPDDRFIGVNASAAADSLEYHHEFFLIRSRDGRNSENPAIGAVLILGRQLICGSTAQRQFVDEALYLAEIAINRWHRDSALRQSELQLQQAQQRARLGAWRLNMQTGRIESSPDVHRLLGRPSGYKGNLEAFLRETVHPDDALELQKTLANAASHLNVAHSIDVRYLVSGDIRWMFLEGTATLAEDGAVILQGIIQDIDDRKRADAERARLQAELAHAQKLESIGQLAGGIAHDFNNMLAVILGHAEMTIMNTVLSEEQLNHLLAIQQAGERSADLIRQLLTFARRRAVNPEAIDLNQSIGQMLTMLQRLIGKGVELIWNPRRGEASVFIDPMHIDQILANLVVNSRDAICRSGSISISTRCQFVTEPPQVGTSLRQPGRYVVLRVCDTGCGMSQDVLEHMFEPFFTTKPVGKGTGLGLATVFGIVEQNQGFIRCTSRPNKGTTFRIYLPFHDAAAEAAETRTPANRGE